jgi:PKD repeat protein
MHQYLLKPKIHKKWRFFFVAMAFLALTPSLQAFPGGTYTINPSVAASASNYRSFTALANDLRNLTRGDGGAANYALGGAGLQGNVTVNVTPGTYNERFILTAIVGSQATRRVTINGNGSILEFTPTLTTDAGVIDLNGTDFFTFNNLEVRMNQTNYGYCYWLRNGADNNIIKNNRLRCNNITATPNIGSAYIWMSNGTTSNLSGNSGNNNLIDSNDMRSGNGLNHGPYYGVNLQGITTPASANAGNNNIVSNNLIRDFHWGGVFHSATYGTIIRNNTITNQGRVGINAIKYGTYAITCTFIMENNRIFNLNGDIPLTSTIYPIFISMSSTLVPVMESKITNNWIFDFGTGLLQCYLFWNSASLNPAISLDVEYNTIAFDYPTVVNNTNNGTRNVQGSWFRSFSNNILYNNMGGTGQKWLIYDQATTANSIYRWTTYRNNCLFFGPNASGTLNYGWGVQNSLGTTTGDLQSIQDMYTASFPTSNIATNPNFTSINPTSINLTPRSIVMSNKARPISGITIDNSGATRNATTPDIGAIEYSIDMGITAFNLNFPVPSCSGFTSAISGTLRNNSPFTITNPEVAYAINYGPKIVYTVPGNIAPNASLNFSFPNPHVFSIPGPTTVRLFNNGGDDNLSNDTLVASTTITPAPGGSVVTHNTSLSSTSSIFDITGKPDVTFRNEKLVYSLSEPSRLGYTNADYGTKWRAFVSARSINGVNANSLISGNGSAPYRATFEPTAAWEDSIVEVSIRVLSLETFCDTVFRRRVLVAPKANVDFIVPNPLCERTDNVFENETTVSSGSVEYEWSFGDGTPNSQEANPAHRYASFGTYQLTLTATTKPYNFVTSKTVSIDVTEMPIASIINTNKCEGVAVVLGNGTAYAGSGTTVYTWSFSDGSPNINTSTRAAVNKKFNSPGAYRVTLQATADGCTDKVTKTVYQFAKPNAAFVKAQGDCLNDEFTFTNQSAIALGNFGNKWDFNDNGNIASDLSPTYSFQSAGTKKVTLVTVSEFGCLDTAELTINVKQIPTTDFSFPFACDRTPTPFVNNTNLNGETLQSYTWNLGQGAPNTQFAPVVNWSGIGQRNVTLTTRLLNGCSTQVTKSINVGVQPLADFEFETQCEGSEIPFTNLTTYPKGKINYKWNFGDNTISNNAAPVHTYASGQTYSVKLVASIEDGCSDSIVKVVNIAQLPQTCDFNITRNWNAGARAFNFTPIGGSSNGLSYKWITGDGNRLSSNATGASYSYAADIQYCVTMVASTPDGCDCSATKCIDISTDVNPISQFKFNMYPNPSNGQFTIQTDEALVNQEVQIFNTIGELVATVQLNSSNTMINLSHLNSGVYMVKLSANNQVINQKINIIK